MSTAMTKPEVLNLEEAADYLRVSKGTVLRMIAQQGLPGRRVGKEWRFLRAALADWLREPSPKERLLRQAGALADDPDMAGLLKEIYVNRDRPETENR
jgi:excisionase family DNA binding protein